MFTQDEYKLIFDGLDTLVDKQQSDEMMITVLGGVFARSADERKEYLEKRRVEMLEANENAEPLREQIILVKAKLIKMRDRDLIGDLELDALDDD